MLTMLLLIATTLIGQAQAQVQWDEPIDWTMTSSTCSDIAGGEGGGKVFTTTDGSTTWTSDSVEEWLDDVSPEFNPVDVATLGVTANSEAKAAVVSYVACMKDNNAAIPGVIMWANTKGGLSIYEDDYVADGNKYVWDGFVQVGGKDFVKLAPMGPSSGCGSYLPLVVGWLPHTWIPWFLPTPAPGQPDDSAGYECELNTCGGTCSLHLYTGPVTPDFYRCDCAQAGACSTLTNDIEPGFILDANADGVIDGGLIVSD